MDQIKSGYRNLGPKKKASLIATVLVVVTTILALGGQELTSNQEGLAQELISNGLDRWLGSE